MSDRIPAAPAGAGPAGKRLSKAVLVDYELDEHERLLLGQAVRTADICADLQAVVDEEGAIVSAKDGKRVHPALVELRAQRVLLARLLVALRVPLGDQETPSKDGRAPVAAARRAGRVRPEVDRMRRREPPMPARPASPLDDDDFAAALWRQIASRSHRLDKLALGPRQCERLAASRARRAVTDLAEGRSDPWLVPDAAEIVPVALEVGT